MPRSTRHIMAEIEPLAQIAPGAVELQLRLGNIRPIDSRGAVRQRLERKQNSGAGVALARLRASSARNSDWAICASRDCLRLLGAGLLSALVWLRLRCQLLAACAITLD